MTCIYDDPEVFATTAITGFCSVNSRTVRAVTGGVVRSTATPAGKVAVVIGGGSGHYPAFAGFVGPGLADAAIAGDVFASPSAHFVAHVSRLAHKNNCIEYGMHKVMGSYWIMTDALLVGVARRDESGAARDDNAIKATLVEILHLRNAARTRAGSSGYVPVGPCVSSGSHRYFLLFDGGLVPGDGVTGPVESSESTMIGRPGAAAPPEESQETSRNGKSAVHTGLIVRVQAIPRPA